MHNVNSRESQLHELAQQFDDVAELYEWSRPSYPDALVDILTNRTEISNRLVVDVGAGTGKFTELLVAHDAQVIAVEPLDAMRDVCHRKLPGISVVNGSAENLPLETASVDAACAIEAFHWFNPPAAWSEMERVVRPGGAILVAWLHRQDASEWQREVYKLLADVQGDVPSPLEIDEGWKSGWSADSFSPLMENRFRYQVNYEIDRVRAMFATYSYVAALDEDTRSQLLDQICAIASSRGATNSVMLHLDVEAWTCSRL